MRAAAGIMTAGALLLGCAAAPPPPPEHAFARDAVRAAQAQGAGASFRAAIYLGFAEAHLQQAEHRLARGDHEAARGLLLRARADAEIALLITLESAARDATRRTLEEVATLAEALEGGGAR